MGFGGLGQVWRQVVGVRVVVFVEEGGEGFQVGRAEGAGGLLEAQVDTPMTGQSRTLVIENNPGVLTPQEIAERFAPTLLLTITSMAWAVVFGMSIGVMSAVFRNQWPDRLGMTIAVSGISFPAFALGMLLMQVLSVYLGWLPTVGADSWKHYILPSLTLGAAVAAVMARFTRASFVEVIQEDFVRTARAKGVSERVVIAKHCLRNALIPVVTMMGLQFGFLLGGSIVVEAVFNWPGLGRLLVDSVTQRDYPVIQTLVLLFSLEFILINLIVDLLYGFINPTIRYK